MFQNFLRRSSMKQLGMKQITLLFAVQVLRRKSGVYILKVPQRNDEWNSKWREGTKRKNPQKYFCL